MVSLSPKIISILAVAIIVVAATSVFILIPSLNGEDGEGFEVVDMYGRTVIVPYEMEHILALGVGALRFVSYLNCSEMIIDTELREGANFNAKSYMYANPWYATVNNLSNVPFSNMENVINLNPDLIILANADFFTDEIDILDKAGIPVVGILELQGFDNENFRIQMTLLAKVLNREERGIQLLDYLDECVDDLAQRVQNVSNDAKPSAYVGAMSWAGTRPFDYSASTYGPFDLIDANNIITAELTEGSSTPMEFDHERILNINPDFIFIDATGYKMVKTDYESDPAKYDGMSAFVNETVFMTVPFIWYGVNFDNVLVGAYYLGTILYPDQFDDINITEKANEIYGMWVGAECFQDMNEWFEINIGAGITGVPTFLAP